MLYFIYIFMSFLLLMFFIVAVSSFKLMTFLGALMKKWASVGFIFFSTYNQMLIIVSIIFVCVLIFGLYYMQHDIYFISFFSTVILFVLSMIFLLISNSFFILFLGWDGLGITSFVLIFYYSNWRSMNNSVFTLLSNRLGDGLILFFIGLCCLNSLSFDMSMMIYFACPLLLMSLTFTKSAQVPISAWLPAAMSAPTPVSALVHSSTLVTAGVIILLKFFSLIENTSMLTFLFVIGLSTIFVAGLTAMKEYDFKKLVALSTLSQMGLLFLILSFSMKWLCCFHMFSHAFFKSSVFLLVGGWLHYVFSSQDSRSYFGGYNYSLASVIGMYVCLMCLMGLFFTSGFMSKDCFLDMLTTQKHFIMFYYLFIISLILTVFYSFRLMWSVFFKNKKLVNLNNSFSLMMELSPVILIVLSIFSMLWIFNNYMFMYNGLVFDKMKYMILFLCFIVLLMLFVYFMFFMKSMFFLDLLPKKMKFHFSKFLMNFDRNVVDFFFLGASKSFSSAIILFTHFNKFSNFLGFIVLLLSLSVLLII